MTEIPKTLTVVPHFVPSKLDGIALTLQIHQIVFLFAEMGIMY